MLVGIKIDSSTIWIGVIKQNIQVWNCIFKFTLQSFIFIKTDTNMYVYVHTHAHAKDTQETFKCVLSKCTNSEFEMYLKDK